MPAVAFIVNDVDTLSSSMPLKRISISNGFDTETPAFPISPSLNGLSGS